MESESSKDLDWQEYEAITKYIYELLGTEYGIKVRGYGRDCWVKGKSGVEHQVDVLTEQLEGERRLLTAIECKFLKKKITKETVMKLHSVMEDADIDSGIIVCKAGYTKDTMTYAEHKGIKLVELREVVADDNKFGHTIKIGMLDIRAKITRLRPTITTIDLGSKVLTDQQEIMAMYYSTMHTSDRKEVPFGNYIMAFREELDKHKKLLSTITRSFTPERGNLIWKRGEKQLAVEKIVLTGFLAKTDLCSSRSFQLVDQVWMIMKEIFEKKVYKLSKSGIIFLDIDES